MDRTMMFDIEELVAIHQAITIALGEIDPEEVSSDLTNAYNKIDQLVKEFDARELAAR